MGVWRHDGRGLAAAWLRLGRAFTLTVGLASFVIDLPASAQPAEPPQPQYGWQEAWAGADVTKDVWLLYSGVTLAPLSADIHSDGLRLRAAGGYGRYHYKADTSNAGTGLCGNAGQDNCTTTRRQFNVDHSYAEALIGYQQRFGELTAKGLIGIASITHAFDRVDRDNAASGSSIGVKGVVELWLNLGPAAWSSLDLSYASAFDTGALRSRTGWRIVPTVSIGPEMRYDTNVEGQSVRGGGFLRYEWVGGEISLAGGVAGNALVPETKDLAGYGTLNILLQY